MNTCAQTIRKQCIDSCLHFTPSQFIMYSQYIPRNKVVYNVRFSFLHFSTFSQFNFTSLFQSCKSCLNRYLCLVLLPTNDTLFKHCCFLFILLHHALSNFPSLLSFVYSFWSLHHHWSSFFYMTQMDLLNTNWIFESFGQNINERGRMFYLLQIIMWFTILFSCYRLFRL